MKNRPSPRPARSLKRTSVVLVVPTLVIVLVSLISSCASRSVVAQSAAQSTPAAAGSGCAQPGLLFCEDFQELPLGPAASPNWTNDTSDGTLTVEPIAPGSATHVLVAQTTGNGRALMSLNFTPPGNSFYGRMWVFVAAFPTAPSFAHFILVQATGTGNAGMVRPVGGQYVEAQYLTDGGPSRSLWGVGEDGAATGDWTNWRQSATASAGQWQCIQFSMLAADNTVQMSVNGIYNPDLVVSTNDHGGSNVPFILPQVNKLEIGWWLFQADPTPSQFSLYYDDIALSSTPVACGNAPAGA